MISCVKPNFVDVGSIAEIQPGGSMRVTVGDTTIALFGVGDRVYAVEHACLRCGSSLAAGALCGLAVACAGCDWQYDVTTGSVCGVPGLCIDTFEVRIVDGRLMVAARLLPRSSDPGAVATA
jgi:nitrite reductase (NADH) small subunit